jgi:hypothetical protein
MGRTKRDPEESKKSDKEQIIAELGSFDPSSSHFVAQFMSTLGRPRHKCIVVICGQIAQLENLPPLTRIQKKSKELVQKWIHDHWSYVQPRLCEFRLYASDGTLISKDPGQGE